MRISLAVIATLALSAVPLPVQAQSEINPPDSISRIRAALERQPSALQPSPASSSNEVPTFRVGTRERLWTESANEQKPVDTTYGLPTVTGLMMNGIEKIRSAKHSRSERRAQKEVANAFAAFCATNGCSTPKRGQS
jgi:hypothetical protein